MFQRLVRIILRDLLQRHGLQRSRHSIDRSFMAAKFRERLDIQSKCQCLGMEDVCTWEMRVLIISKAGASAA